VTIEIFEVEREERFKEERPFFAVVIELLLLLGFLGVGRGFGNVRAE